MDAGTGRLRRFDVGTVVRELATHFGARISMASAVCEQHGHGECWHPTEAPDAVLFAESMQDVVTAVKLCGAHNVPIIPFGAGTSLEGHVAAREGGLCIDLGRMDKVLRVSQADRDCTVQAGVRRTSLNAALRDLGLFFPIDPGADATIGGMASTRASGTNAVRYGTMRENVLGVTAVLANGDVMDVGGRARKSAAGYDLTRLLVGSEGTLAIITSLTLKLHGIPEEISAAVCVFPTVAAAVSAVIETIQHNVPVARIELLDDVQIAACNAYSGLSLKVAPTIFYEFHGTALGVREQAETAAAVAALHGGEDFEWATTLAARTKLWTARHNAWYAMLALRPGSRGVATDVCVPISVLGECIAETKRDLAATQIPVVLVGHVGDGNFHLGFAVNPDDPGELAEVERINERLVRRALAFGGTCSGEHGVGYGKMAWLTEECGAASVRAMRAVKKALDPLNILNPGKMVTF